MKTSEACVTGFMHHQGAVQTCTGADITANEELISSSRGQIGNSFHFCAGKPEGEAGQWLHFNLWAQLTLD